MVKNYFERIKLIQTAFPVGSRSNVGEYGPKQIPVWRN